MCCRVAALQHPVMGPGYHFATPCNDCPNGDFILRLSLGCNTARYEPRQTTSLPILVQSQIGTAEGQITFAASSSATFMKCSSSPLADAWQHRRARGQLLAARHRPSRTACKVRALLATRPWDMDPPPAQPNRRPRRSPAPSICAVRPQRRAQGSLSWRVAVREGPWAPARVWGERSSAKSAMHGTAARVGVRVETLSVPVMLS